MEKGIFLQTQLRENNCFQALGENSTVHCNRFSRSEANDVQYENGLSLSLKEGFEKFFCSQM